MVPILAIQSLLGGIDLNAVAGALLVTLGVALCGSSAALFLSTWGTKVHEVLLATYAAWALYLVAVPMWWGYLGVFGRGLAPPGWFLKANPLWMVAAPYLWPNAVNLWDFAAYLAISVIVSAALASVGAARLRPIAARDPGQPRRGARPREGSRILAQLLSLVPGPSLDANPVLWREWHRRRPSRWAGVVWSLYGVMTFGLTATLIALNLSGTPDRLQVASVGNGFQAGIGLLLLSVSAATALAEERVRGNLDALLVTPLATRSIVWGKWCGAYRGVPIVAICPGVLAAVLARQSGRWEGVLWIVGLFLAYGAAVTSLGLALATWIRRVDLAVALNVSVLGGVTVGWLFLVVFAAPERAADRARRWQPDHRNYISDDGHAVLPAARVGGVAPVVDRLDGNLRLDRGSALLGSTHHFRRLRGPDARHAALESLHAPTKPRRAACLRLTTDDYDRVTRSMTSSRSSTREGRSRQAKAPAALAWVTVARSANPIKAITGPAATDRRASLWLQSGSRTGTSQIVNTASAGDSGSPAGKSLASPENGVSSPGRSSVRLAS